MQSYRIGLALADDSISPYRRADSAAALALEFESRLVSPRLVNAIPGRRGDQVHTAYTRVHGDLGQRVNEKTRDLKRSNHSLDLLYRTSQTLHDAPISDQPLRLALADIQTQLAVGPTVLCLRDSDRSAHSSRIITPEPVAKLDLC